MFVKICGLRTPVAVEAAVAAGADALGFVFADSPRRVTPDEAVTLCRGLPAHVLRVAVMLHPTAGEWAVVREKFAPHLLQTDVEDFAGLELGHTRRLPVYRDGEALDEAGLAREEWALFEAVHSGSGSQPDWDRAARLATGVRLVLAGGLRPDNVAEAVRRVRPAGVDVSSGVESAPGEKDPRRIAEFVAAARAAGQTGQSTCLQH